MQAGYLDNVILYLGASDMRFLEPLYPGDAIRVETEVTAKSLTSKGWICEYDWTMRSQVATAAVQGRNI